MLIPRVLQVIFWGPGIFMDLFDLDANKKTLIWRRVFGTIGIITAVIAIVFVVTTMSPIKYGPTFVVYLLEGTAAHYFLKWKYKVGIFW